MCIISGREYHFYKYLAEKYHAEGSLAAGWDIITSRDVITAIAANSKYVVDNYGDDMTEDFAFGVYVRKDLGVPFAKNPVTEITGLNSTLKSRDISNLNSVLQHIDKTEIAARVKTDWAGSGRFCADFPVFKALLREFYGVDDDAWIPEAAKMKAREECNSTYDYCLTVGHFGCY